MGRAGEGNAEGSPTGFQHPVRWKSDVFGDAVNGVPATTHIQLAGRAVDRGRRLSALFRRTAAVCTAHHEPRRHGRQVRHRVLYVDPSDWKLQVGSVRHHRGWHAQIQGGRASEVREERIDHEDHYRQHGDDERHRGQGKELARLVHARFDGGAPNKP